MNETLLATRIGRRNGSLKAKSRTDEREKSEREGGWVVRKGVAEGTKRTEVGTKVEDEQKRAGWKESFSGVRFTRKVRVHRKYVRMYTGVYTRNGFCSNVESPHPSPRRPSWSAPLFCLAISFFSLREERKAGVAGT